MTSFLKQLLRQFGMVYMTVSHLSIRPGSKFETLEEYDQSLGGVEQSEPILVVRISKDGKAGLTQYPPNTKEFGEQYERAKISVLDLSESEFYFFQAFRPALFDMDKQLPEFLSQMSYVFSYELFEGYIRNILHQQLIARAEPAENIDKKLRQLMRQPIGDTLRSLGQDLGLSQLESADNKVVEISMVRNCLIHNSGIVDSRLTTIYPSYSVGDHIEVTVETLSKAISVLKGAALTIDSAFEMSMP